MGMDVYGNAPKSKAGEYFRANIWGWHPLWDYCIAVAPDIIPAKVAREGHCNDGAGLDDSASCKLAARLRERLIPATDMAAQELPDYVKQFAAMFGAPLPTAASTFDWERVERFAAFLDACGGFRIE